jgi:mono/diheme cytochrome c family protein
MRALTLIAVGLIATGCSVKPFHPRSSVGVAPPDLSTALEWEAASRGRAIAQVGCASCHAIQATGASPLPAATPFRDIVRRRSLDDIEAGMAQGLVTSHPAMPLYTFRAAEIDDLRAYLETLKVDASRR